MAELGSTKIYGNQTVTGDQNVLGDISVEGTVDGRDIASDGSKLDGIESGATADQTASEILTAIKTVDGAGSGLDADTLDGVQASGFATASHTHNYLPLSGGTLTGDVTGTTFNASNFKPSNAVYFGGGNNYLNWTNNRIYSNVGIESNIGLYVSGNTVWHAGNDGSGSGLDADTVDGTQLSAITHSGDAVTLTGDVSGSTTVASDGSISITATVGNDSHFHSQVYIPDTRGAARAPSYYPDRYTSFDFQNTSDTGAGGDDWHVLQTIAPWSSYNDAHRQQQLAFTGTGGIKFRYATSDSAWAGWQTVWTSGNDGSGSGLDADTVDGIQGSSIITNSSTQSSQIHIRNGSPTIYLRDTDQRSSMIHCNSNLFYVLRGSAADSTSWTAYNGLWPLTINLENNDITGGGNITAYSDRRLKDNIVELNTDIERFMSVKAKKFRWKDSKREDIGFIAQDVEDAGFTDVVKEAENRDPETGELYDTYKTLDYGRMVAYVWDIVSQQEKAIRELKAKIEEIKKG